MKERFFGILINPFFLSGIIAVAAYFSLPQYFLKYKLEVESVTDSKGHRVYYVDLNKDGDFEILFGSKSDSFVIPASFILFSPNGDLIDQWNFGADLVSTWGDRGDYWFFDSNDDGYKEVFLITHRNDSAFLSWTQPFSKQRLSFEINEVFIDHTTGRDFDIKGKMHFSKSRDGSSQLFFGLMAGRIGYPRNVYKYDFEEDSIYKSPHLTNLSFLDYYSELNSDDKNGLILGSRSYGNQLDRTYTTRSDYSLWLNVFNEDLEFLFEPVEFALPFSELHVLPINNTGTTELVLLINSQRQEISPSKLLVYSIKGERLREYELGLGIFSIYLDSNQENIVVYAESNGEIKYLNFDLEEKASTAEITPFSELFDIDVDGDGEKEWFSVMADKKSFKIYDEGFEHEISFDFQGLGLEIDFHGVKKTEGGSLFFIQDENLLYLFNYKANELYFFNYLMPPTTYLTVLLFVLLINKGQKIRTERQRLIERQILELQLKTIKNQIDPHFVFNAMNSISEMTLTDNKLEADRFIGKVSKMMREVLEKSDKIVTTLEEEINFTENFIQVQQIRFNNKFSYHFEIDKAVNLDIQVPKHVLYSYVENAIKHGLANKIDGLLTIFISRESERLQLIIEDNGVGFGKSKTTKHNSTGRGLEIMQKVYELFGKLQKKKITFRIEGVPEADGNVKGTRVIVNIDD